MSRYIRVSGWWVVSACICGLSAGVAIAFVAQVLWGVPVSVLDLGCIPATLIGLIAGVQGVRRDCAAYRAARAQLTRDPGSSE